MRISSRFTSFAPALAVSLVLLLVLTTGAKAQLMVAFKINKTTHLMGEEVLGEVTVFNRAGRDIILDGPGDQSWLAINVTNPNGQVVSKTRKKSRQPSVIIRSGQALKRQIKVTDYVDFEDFGNFGLTASVYFPEKRSFFASDRVRVDITDGQVFWEQVVGVPQGQIGAGTYRKYQLLTHNSTQRTELYTRIRDDTGHFEYGTFSLGTIILYRDPQVTVDGKNQMHVLFMAKPRTYRHIVISTNGAIVSQRIYEEDGSNRPRMLVNQAGDVNIRGGIFQDPRASEAPPAGEEGPGLIRSINDRRIPGQ